MSQWMASGVDMALVRLSLAALSEEYGRRIALAQSGAERHALLQDWATCARRELSGLDSEEAASLRALYGAMVEGAEP